MPLSMTRRKLRIVISCDSRADEHHQPSAPQARVLQTDDDPAYVRYDAAWSQSERTFLSRKVIVIIEAIQHRTVAPNFSCALLDGAP